MKITDTYTFFYGSTEVFSNWYMKDFKHNGRTFNCSEQAMMYEKALLMGDQETANEILKSPHPSNQKVLGRMIKPWDEDKWLKNRDDIMYRVLHSKFMDAELQKHLLANPKTIFVEASGTDKIWGIGMREDAAGVEDPKNWKGLNLLGVALNKVLDVILDQNKSIQNVIDGQGTRIPLQ